MKAFSTFVLFITIAFGTAWSQESRNVQFTSLAWSPDGQQFVYYLEKGDNKDQIWLTDAEGRSPRNISNDTLHSYYPAWPPGGDIIFRRSFDNRQSVCLGRFGKSEGFYLPDRPCGSDAPTEKMV